MPNLINSITIGALVREGRESAGLTQTQLAERIGASRFWVAAFEKGKPRAELGLALKAIHALGMTIQIGPAGDASANETPVEESETRPSSVSDTSLAAVLARATLTHPARSTVWAGPSPQRRTARQPKQPQRKNAVGKA